MKLPGFYDIFQKRWEEFQTIWVYSDPHFDDEELTAGVSGRPSADELVERINKCVGKRDAIIFLGDIGNVEYVKRIKGYKILVMGNHDAGASNYKRVEKTLYYDEEKYTEEESLAAAKEEYSGYKIEYYGEHHDFHRPFVTHSIHVDNHLFDEVYEGPLMVGEKILLSHEPINIPWAYNLHGHDHSGKNTSQSIKTHYNCCSDVIDYDPVHLGKLLFKVGISKNIQSVHRATIDKATERKKKRNK